jgi:uncharacterized membrane protein YkvA (DUF1232 family)
MELSSSSSKPSASRSRSVPTFSSDLTASRIATAVADAAQTVLRRRFRVVLLVRDAYEHLTANASALQAVQDDLKTMLRLMLSWVNRSYARVPWSALVMMAGAVCYFVMPADLIPDLLGPFGFVDDAAVIGTVVQSVRTELDRFRTWERTQLPGATGR